MKRTTILPCASRPAKSKPPRTAASRPLDRYLRAVNYLATAQVYLQANPLLEKPLRPAHIRERLLGHWGTCPGINFIYAHLNQLIRKTDASVLLLTGPGHGAADLIVIATHGFTGLKHIQLGDTAETVLQRVDCSVLTVKPDGFVSPVKPD